MRVVRTDGAHQRRYEERVEPTYLARLARLTEDHQTAAARGQATSELGDVARAVAAARVGVLLVEADRVIPGGSTPKPAKSFRPRLPPPRSMT